MRKIQILGSGCSRCTALFEATDRAVREMGLDCELEKTTDMESIARYGAMTTPALVVDGAVRLSGRVPSLVELKELLSA